jgi:hypothetical protein
VADPVAPWNANAVSTRRPFNATFTALTPDNAKHQRPAIIQREAQPASIIHGGGGNAGSVQSIAATIARQSIRTITPRRSRFALDGTDAFQRLYHHPKHFLDRGGQLDARGDQSARWHDITRH